MKIKKKQNPVFGIVMMLAVLFTVVEGAFFIMRVMEKNLDADMAMYDHELTNLLHWMGADELTMPEIKNLARDLNESKEVSLGGYEAVYIFDSENLEITGTGLRYPQIPREDIYRDGENYFDDDRFLSIMRRLFREDSFVLEKTNWSMEEPTRTRLEVVNAIGFELLKSLSSYEFVFPEKAYFQKEIVTADGAEYTIVFMRNITISGRTMQQMIYLILIYVAVLLIMWVISILQAIARADDYKRLQKVAYFDELTGIINRPRFVIDGKKLLKKRRNRNYALIATDIHKFKIINDFYGEEKANQILCEMAAFLQNECGKGELVCRDQSDIFLLLFLYEEDKQIKERIKIIDKKMKGLFADVNVKFKFGIYPVQEKAQDICRAINYAEMAKDSITSPDKNIFILGSSQKDQIRKEKELENEMEKALSKREFLMYLQPKYRTDGTKIVGAEALVRWNSKTLGFIAPGEFIPLFEKNGFIMKLDQYMLSAVCSQQKKWIEEGRELVPISVNISRVHLMDPDLVSDIVTTVDFYGVPHEYIELELTESAFFEDKQVLIDTIKQLQQAGFSVSMDDFGSGYSSLNSLKDLPLDVIKLDGEFFRESEDLERSNRIVKNTVELAQHLNMKIVAEGIEKQSQVQFLQEIGCDLIQGFYYAKPMEVTAFEELLYKKAEFVTNSMEMA